MEEYDSLRLRYGTHAVQPVNKPSVGDKKRNGETRQPNAKTAESEAFQRLRQSRKGSVGGWNPGDPIGKALERAKELIATQLAIDKSTVGWEATAMGLVAKTKPVPLGSCSEPPWSTATFRAQMKFPSMKANDISRLRAAHEQSQLCTSY